MINWVQDANDNFSIRIKNSGGYIAQFYISYQVGGVSSRLDSGAFSLGFSKMLNIPTNAEMVYIDLDIWIFGGLRHLLENYNISTANHCYNLIGTIFDAVMNEVPCDMLGADDPPSPPKKCCKYCCRCCCRRPTKC